ncbi:Rha family transcriptional regulator [Methanoculleus sp.]|uniref:Rha family transcriptional regulator n=1 Tax=Methanoculleus sp. TaxID=90427 RepID=UPI0025ED8616|nr:Rha family transcriptional regulator [Methanoculleus sp.]MCK9320210.1 Rha family transcriptional regulator [Methanoculleus sp.]
MKEMTDYVFENRKKVVTDSLIVAEKFGKAHRDVLRSIDNLTVQNCAVKKMFHETKFMNNRGKEYRKFDMTRDGFSILVMGFTGKQALDFKVAFIEAFNRMESFISQRVNVEWKKAREEGKELRSELTDTIAEFVEYAKNQGSKNAGFYYSTISRETYKALKIIEKSEKITTKVRDLLNSMDLAFLGLCEQIAKNAIQDGMSRELHYKEIYALAKDKILEFGKAISALNTKKQELLTA